MNISRERTYQPAQTTPDSLKTEKRRQQERQALEQPRRNTLGPVILAHENNHIHDILNGYARPYSEA